MRIAAALLALSLTALPAHAEVKRVVSLNPCLDAILINVAEREQIAALSHYARDKNSSTIVEAALTFPKTFETAEEVMALSPDLVLTSRHSSLATRNAFKELKIPTELFDEPQSVRESLAQVRRIADLVGHPEKGEELISAIEAALADAAPPRDTKPVPVLLFLSGGFSTGGGTLVDEMMKRTGFENTAGNYGLVGWGNIPLELVIANPPPVLLAGAILADKPTWADRILRHPALQAESARMKRITFSERFIYCGGPVLMKSAAALKQARNLVAGGAP